MVINQPRSSQRLEAKPRADEAPRVKRMLQLARAKPRYGYRRIGWLLREKGWRAGLSRVFRLWQWQGLKVPVKTRRLGSRARSGYV
jgi:putative transposase